ncbi:MAG: SsrA-binding protein SmpB [Pseudomonadota bacterium]|nr:SsrA-binding protein SmpB [Pseudomonadota bacterium]
MSKDPSPERMAAQNRRARFDYFIEETLEAGIILTGTEVKSLRSGRASINEAHAGEKDGELYLFNAYIPEYTLAGKFHQHETRRPRKLLVHRKEMNRLLGAVKREGITIVPLSITFNKRGMAKVNIGIAKGKKQADKRQAVKDRDWKRDKARLLASKN